MNKKTKGVYIDDRDLKLFSYLHAVKVANYEQIHRDIYPDICLDAAGLRLRKLEDAKFLEIGRNRLLMKGKRYVNLKRNTFDSFVRKGQELQVELKSDAMLHDMKLVDIRHRFLNSSKTRNYQTENQIQTWDPKNKHLNSDAIVTSCLNDQPFLIPIEYESTLKKADRYEPFVNKYYQATDYPVILLLAESQAIIARIMETERDLYNWDKPKFFCKLIDHLNHDDPLIFSNCHNFKIDLG